MQVPKFVVRDVPRLTLSQGLRRPPPRHDPTKEYRFRYRSKRHAALPHVVKFSGGRSSGMLLFALLENGLLKRERGDVVVFNNTSAEHPNTYRFVADCMRTARRYGIPFYQIEFQTYEDSRRGEWTRLPTYRMVNDTPKSDANLDGFHWKGEVFEELLSWAGYVPNQFNRICTRHLKLEVTRSFLKDWLASKPTIPRLGHFGNSSRIDEDAAYRRHLDNQGGVPRNIFQRKREFVWNRPHIRPEQRYDDFCDGWKPFENPKLKGKTLGDKAWFGKGGVEYIAFIGLRHDEPHRVQRVSDRNDTTAGYEGEHVYMPLADMVVTRSDVNDFWEKQEWDLSLPQDTSLSNCQRRLKIWPRGGAKDCHLGWWSELGVRLGFGDAAREFFGGSGQRSHAELKRSAPAGRPQGGMVYRVGVGLSTRASEARCRPGPGDGVPQFSYRHCFCGRGSG